MPDAQYWRDRAEEVRASAEAMHEPVARQTLLKIPTNTKGSHIKYSEQVTPQINTNIDT